MVDESTRDCQYLRFPRISFSAANIGNVEPTYLVR